MNVIRSRQRWRRRKHWSLLHCKIKRSSNKLQWTKLVAFFEKEVASAKEPRCTAKKEKKKHDESIWPCDLWSRSCRVYYKAATTTFCLSYSKNSVVMLTTYGIYAKNCCASSRSESNQADRRYETQPPLAMVDSDRSITTTYQAISLLMSACNLRSSGSCQMWDPKTAKRYWLMIPG